MGDPTPGLGLRLIRTRGDPYLVGDHKDGVEANPKLTDDLIELRSLAITVLLLAELLQEGHRTRVGDRAQVLDQLLPCHPNTGIRYRQGVGLRIALNTDREFDLGIQNVLMGQHQELHAMQGVGCIGDQLT